MKRRDFLLLRTCSEVRTAELSCERLYMRYVDARRSTDGAVDEDWEPWMGEPPLRRDGCSMEDLFEELESSLREVQVLRVVDGRWMTSDGLRLLVQELLASFRAGGGRVEYVD